MNIPLSPDHQCEDCGTKIEKGQSESTKRTLLKELCPACARKENARTAELALTPRDKLLMYLARNGFREQSMTRGLFIQSGPTDIAVDLRHEKPLVGVLRGAEIITEGHGVMRVDDYQREIEGILSSKNGAGPTEEQPVPPKDVTATPAPALAPEKPAPSPVSQPEKTQAPVKKPIVSNRELSFGRMIDDGLNREEIMRIKGMSEREFENALVSLNHIRGR